MNYITIFFGMILLISLALCFKKKSQEGFRPRRMRRSRYFWDGPQAYLHRFRRRRPIPTRYFWDDWDWDLDWQYDYLYPMREFSSWFVPFKCKRGCTPNGNCPSPGVSPDECVWASDCNGC